MKNYSKHKYFYIFRIEKTKKIEYICQTQMLSHRDYILREKTIKYCIIIMYSTKYPNHEWSFCLMLLIDNIDVFLACGW